MNTAYKSIAFAVASFAISSLAPVNAEPLSEFLHAYANTSADGDDGGRDQIWKSFRNEDIGANKEFPLYSEASGAQASGSVSNHIYIQFDPAERGSILVTADLPYENNAPKEQWPQPHGNIQYYTNWGLTYKAEFDGVLAINMNAESFAFVEGEESSFQPSATFKVSGSGESAKIHFTQGEYEDGVESVSIPTVKGKLYSITFSGGMGTSGGIKSQHRYGHFVANWEFKSEAY